MILFAVGFPVIVVIIGGRMVEVFSVAGIGVLVVFVTSGLQYILIAEWNPMYFALLMEIMFCVETPTNNMISTGTHVPHANPPQNL